MKSPRQETILESQLVLLATQGAGMLLGLVVTLLLARRLDDEAFAAFVLAAGALSLADRVVDAGWQGAVVAELSRGSGRSWPLLREVMKRRGALALLSLCVAWAGHALLPSALNWWLFSLAILLMPLRTAAALFQARRLFRHSALGGLCIRGAFCLALWWVTSWPQDVLPGVLVVLLLREVAQSLYPLRALCSAEDDGADVSPASGFPRGLWLLAPAALFGAAYFSMDVFMLEAFSSTTDVAGYGLALRVLAPLIVTVSLILSPFLPWLSCGLEAGFLPSWRQLVLTALGGLGAMVPLACLLLHSETIMIVLAGESRPLAAGALEVLAPVLPLVVVGTAFSTALILGRRYGQWALVCFSGFLINGILNLMWIPKCGASGAAWATVATEAWVALVLVVMLKRRSKTHSTVPRVSLSAIIWKSLIPTLIVFPVAVAGLFLPQPWGAGAALVLVLVTSAHHLLRGAGRLIRQELEAPAQNRQEGY